MVRRCREWMDGAVREFEYLETAAEWTRVEGRWDGQFVGYVCRCPELG
jgi:hypothetical protein